MTFGDRVDQIEAELRQRFGDHVDVPDLCRYFGVDRSTIWRWRRRQPLRTVGHGSPRFDVRDAARWVAGR